MLISNDNFDYWVTHPF